MGQLCAVRGFGDRDEPQITTSRGDWDWNFFPPGEVDGCSTIFPGDTAGGDNYMVKRMGMDSTREFQFVFDDFDDNQPWTLTPP